MLEMKKDSSVKNLKMQKVVVKHMTKAIGLNLIKKILMILNIDDRKNLK